MIWGANNHTGAVHGDVLAVWKNDGSDVVGGPISCGHHVTEEAPDETFDWFMKFFRDERRGR